MRLLIANDDGIYSPGILALAELDRAKIWLRQHGQNLYDEDGELGPGLRARRRVGLSNDGGEGGEGVEEGESERGVMKLLLSFDRGG